MKPDIDTTNLHRRIKMTIGQLNAIDKMLDENIPCEEIIIQINSVKSALHKAAQMILTEHLERCIGDNMNEADMEKTMQKFSRALEHFSRLG